MDISFFAQKRLAWRNSLSDEDKNKLIEEKKTWEAEETKAERMAEFMATFTSSDTDNDGLLNRQEFEDFLTKLGQNAGARGVPNQDMGEYDEE